MKAQVGNLDSPKMIWLKLGLVLQMASPEANVRLQAVQQYAVECENPNIETHQIILIIA